MSGPTGRVAMLRFNDLPYMTEPERGEFSRLRNGGTVTIFGVSECAAQGCEKEVPRGVKLYCSKVCWKKEEGPTNEEKEDETGAVDR